MVSALHLSILAWKFFFPISIIIAGSSFTLNRLVFSEDRVGRRLGRKESILIYFLFSCIAIFHSNLKQRFWTEVVCRINYYYPILCNLVVLSLKPKSFSLGQKSQCAHSIFNLDQKFHGLSCFWGIDIHETVQNQSRKTSVIRLSRFTTANMARKCLQ